MFQACHLTPLAEDPSPYSGSASASPFTVTGVDPEYYAHLFGRTKDYLRNLNVFRFAVPEASCLADVFEMTELDAGEIAFAIPLIALRTPALPQERSFMFFREGGTQRKILNEIPHSLKIRLLSIRAIDSRGYFISAEVCDGEGAQPIFRRMLRNLVVARLHVYCAASGAFLARVDRG